MRRNYSQMTVPGSQAVVKAAVTRCCQESTSSGLAPSTTSNILFKEPKNYKSRRFFSNKEMFLYHIFYLIFISLILINPNRFSQTFLFITYTLLFPFTYYKHGVWLTPDYSITIIMNKDTVCWSSRASHMPSYCT